MVTCPGDPRPQAARLRPAGWAGGTEAGWSRSYATQSYDDLLNRGTRPGMCCITLVWRVPLGDVKGGD